MNELENIYQTFTMVDGWLNSEAARLRHPDVEAWERKEELNTYGYFILLFGQLEEHVNQEYRDRFGTIEETIFWDRVSELFHDAEISAGPEIYSGQGNVNVAELIMKYYSIRNEIAHGRIGTGKIGGALHILGIYQNIRTIIESA